MNAGFTLLETIVAFAILSLVTITGFGILGDSFQGLARIEAHEDLNVRAENLLNLMVMGLLPSESDIEGLTVMETPVLPIETSDLQPIRVQIAAGGTLLIDSIIVRKKLP
jgi:type II secretory pathway pseudopilin PulG